MKLGCHLTRQTNQFLERLLRLFLPKRQQQLLVMEAPKKKSQRGLHKLKISLRSVLFLLLWLVLLNTSALFFLFYFLVLQFNIGVTSLKTACFWLYALACVFIDFFFLLSAISNFHHSNLQAAEQEYEKEKLNERIAKLAGGVAVIQV